MRLVHATVGIRARAGRTTRAANLAVPLVRTILADIGIFPDDFLRLLQS